MGGACTGFFFNCWLNSTNWGGLLGGRMEACRWDAPVPVNANGRVYRSVIQGVFRNDGDVEIRGQALASTAYEVGESFVTVETTDDEAQNGQNLIAACGTAAGLTPHGLPLSRSNRVAVLVPPGRYDLGTGQLTLSSEFVDLIGLCSARDDQHIFGESSGMGSGVLGQTADDVRIENLLVECTRSSGGKGTSSNSPSAYFPESGLSSTVVRNCRFKSDDANAYSMRIKMDYAGRYEHCHAGDNAFGGDESTASGTFIDCTAGDASFGGYLGDATGVFTGCQGGDGSFARKGTASGTFTDCSAGVMSFGGGGGKAEGTFTRCTGGVQSFGAGISAIASGTFRECTGGIDSFGGHRATASGVFIDCVGSDGCFGSSQGTEASGLFVGCIAGAMSFGFEGDASGKFINCVGGLYSFGGRGTPQGQVSGWFYNCWLNSSTWGGWLSGRMEGCRWGDDVSVLDGAKVYDSTIAGTIIGIDSGNCKIAHVRCQGMSLGSVTNRIGVPHNVVDSDVD